MKNVLTKSSLTIALSLLGCFASAEGGSQVGSAEVAAATEKVECLKNLSPEMSALNSKIYEIALSANGDHDAAGKLWDSGFGSVVESLDKFCGKIGKIKVSK